VSTLTESLSNKLTRLLMVWLVYFKSNALLVRYIVYSHRAKGTKTGLPITFLSVGLALFYWHALGDNRNTNYKGRSAEFYYHTFFWKKFLSYLTVQMPRIVELSDPWTVDVFWCSVICIAARTDSHFSPCHPSPVLVLFLQYLLNRFLYQPFSVPVLFFNRLRMSKRLYSVLVHYFTHTFSCQAF
jgi:hypothetical protein